MSQEDIFDQNPEFSPVNENPAIRAKILGVGGAGISLVDGLRLDNFNGVDHLVIDVDSRALGDSIADRKMPIGRTLTRGMGTGGEFSIARKAMENEKEALAAQLDGMDIVFLLAGLGGGTGGGATPEIARIARDAGAIVFAFCPMPFSWEKARHTQAENALAELRKHANAVIPLPNDSLLQIGGNDATALECFAEAGRNVSRGISAICSLIFRRGMIDVDFVHLRNAFNRRAGRTLFGYGEGRGDQAIRKALSELLICPMLHLPDVSKAADALLVFICGGPNMGMNSLQQVSLEIREQFKAGEHVVFGAHVDENMGDQVQIIVLGATDLEAGLQADVAPVAEQVIQASPQTKKAHQSKLSAKRKAEAKAKAEKTASSSKGRKKGRYSEDQNMFDFMEEGNQRGIFDDLADKNLYEGEDLDVPSYLRRGVKIAV
ncbi:MAG: cell division protein FtsZ [Verrucomicrobiota bacterium]|nr:cell division protein FtsZ [Verrucomicrobiota bacterium]